MTLSGHTAYADLAEVLIKMEASYASKQSITISVGIRGGSCMRILGRRYVSERLEMERSQHTPEVFIFTNNLLMSSRTAGKSLHSLVSSK